MNQALMRKYQYKVKKVDVTDFCGIENYEFVSEDGLNELIKQVVISIQDGWEFQDCARSEKNPCIIHLNFRREA